MTELMLQDFTQFDVLKNAIFSPTPPSFRVGRRTFLTLVFQKQPLRGNIVASQHSFFCATLKKGARGRSGGG